MIARRLMLAAIGATALLGAIPQAHADWVRPGYYHDEGRSEWRERAWRERERERQWREHEWREHHRGYDAPYRGW
jgi:hypothetical protein